MFLPIENDDGVRRGQIDAHAARTRGEQEDEGGYVLVEAIDGLLAVIARHSAVQTLAERGTKGGHRGVSVCVCMRYERMYARM